MKITKLGGLIAQFIVRSILRDRIKAAQSRDSDLVELMEKIRGKKFTDFNLDNEGVLWINERLYVTSVDNLREEILEEAHYTAYSVHPGSTKMYYNIKDIYWWDKIKKDVAEFISKYLTCQQVKAEHQNPSGKL